VEGEEGDCVTGDVGEQLRLVRLDLAGRLCCRARRGDKAHALRLGGERGRDEFRLLAGLELGHSPAGDPTESAPERAHEVLSSGERGDRRLLGKLGERVLERLVGGKVLAFGFLPEAVDLGLGVGEDEPAPDLADQHVLPGLVALVRLLDGLPELVLVLRLRQADDVLAPTLEVEPHERELVAERGLDVAFPVELRVLLERRAGRADELLTVRELAQERLDLLPLVGVDVGIDRDEGGRGRRRDLGGSRGGLLLAAAAGREGREKGDEEKARNPHGGHATRRSAGAPSGRRPARAGSRRRGSRRPRA
jgi:hypothetical protein